MKEATPAKLKNGDWGARTPTSQSPGDLATLRVTTKAGKSWTAEHKCVASGSDWALWVKTCTTRTPPRKPRKRLGCVHCGEWINSRNQKCWETGGVCVPDYDEF